MIQYNSFETTRMANFMENVFKKALIHIPVVYINTMFIESNQDTKHPEVGP